MRAMDIAIYILVLNMTTSVVGNVIWPMMTTTSYFTQGIQSSQVSNSSGNANTQGYIIGTGDYTNSRQATNNFIGGQKDLKYDPLSGTFMMLWQGFTFMIGIFAQTMTILPMLINQWGVPLWLAGIIQSIIYITYGWAIAQFASGRSGKLME